MPGPIALDGSSVFGFVTKNGKMTSEGVAVSGVWNYGAQMGSDDLGRGIEANGSAIAGGAVHIPNFTILSTFKALHDLTINRLVVESTGGTSDGSARATGFGIFFGLGSSTQQGPDYLYDGANELDEAISLAVPAGTYVSVRYTTGDQPNYTKVQLIWTKD